MKFGKVVPVAAAIAALCLVIVACGDSSNPVSPRSVTGGVAATEPAPPEPTPEPSPEPTPTENGRFTGGGFQVNASGIKVTRGFTLHCDAILSNNFEVNWDGGNNFHMYKNPTDVVCTLLDDPNPPDAPVNKIVINGFGRLNGIENVPFSLALVDNGEKAGAPLDQAYININGVNLTGGSAAAPLPIDGGNIQAHFDQPHK
jgi:hypothetical protein